MGNRVKDVVIVRNIAKSVDFFLFIVIIIVETVVSRYLWITIL